MSCLLRRRHRRILCVRVRAPAPACTTDRKGSQTDPSEQAAAVVTTLMRSRRWMASRAIERAIEEDRRSEQSVRQSRTWTKWRARTRTDWERVFPPHPTSHDSITGLPQFVAEEMEHLFHLRNGKLKQSCIILKGRTASKWGVGQRRRLPPCGRTDGRTKVANVALK